MQSNGQNILISLKEDMPLHRDILQKVAAEVRKNNISRYPVFVAARDVAPLGKLIVDKEVYKTHWNINASTLEELVVKKIIDIEKVENFKHAYKDPDEQACFLIIEENTAQFVFVPYSAIG